MAHYSKCLLPAGQSSGNVLAFLVTPRGNAALPPSYQGASAPEARPCPIHTGLPPVMPSCGTSLELLTLSSADPTTECPDLTEGGTEFPQGSGCLSSTRAGHPAGGAFRPEPGSGSVPE